MDNIKTFDDGFKSYFSFITYFLSKANEEEQEQKDARLAAFGNAKGANISDELGIIDPSKWNTRV